MNLVPLNFSARKAEPIHKTKWVDLINEWVPRDNNLRIVVFINDDTFICRFGW